MQLKGPGIPNERALNPALAQWAVQAFTRILSWFAIIEGLVITFGGPVRFGGHDFLIALKVPGSPATWGIFILIAGLVTFIATLTNSLRVISISLLAGSFWASCLAVTFIISAVVSEHAALTSIAVYTVVALLYAIMGGVYYDASKEVYTLGGPNTDSSSESV